MCDATEGDSLGPGVPAIHVHPGIAPQICQHLELPWKGQRGTGPGGVLPALRMGTVIMSFCGGCPGKAGPLSLLHLGTHASHWEPWEGPLGVITPFSRQASPRHRPGWSMAQPRGRRGAELGWTPGSPALLTAKLTVTRKRGGIPSSYPKTI